MRVYISISGQIGGNHILLNCLNNGDYEKGMFYGYKVFFETKAEAVKAMRTAYNELKERGARASKNRNTMYYDASKAIIHPID